MKKVTMKDVAAAAGVSVAAVSRVMNGSGYVAPDKREAILQAISTVGYRAQRAARPPDPAHWADFAQCQWPAVFLPAVRSTHVRGIGQRV